MGMEGLRHKTSGVPQPSAVALQRRISMSKSVWKYGIMAQCASNPRIPAVVFPRTKDKQGICVRSLSQSYVTEVEFRDGEGGRHHFGCQPRILP